MQRDPVAEDPEGFASGELSDMIFKNQNIGHEVTVDLDTFFYFFVRPEREWPDGEKQGITLRSIRGRLDRMSTAVHEYPVTYYRRSSNDHVHVRLHFENEITVLDAFMIRAWLFDDQTRLSLDLARYLSTGSLHEMNRCFDEKATINGVKQAGPWIPIHVSRDQYVSDILDDWDQYLSRWTRGQGQRPLIIGS
jgi:hypothetical protein